MSTPAWKKRLNVQKQAEVKRRRDYDKMFAVDPSYKKEFKVLSWNPAPPRGSDVKVKSVIDHKGQTPKVEPKVYTGTLVKGIATMHKSNAVPVINQEEATDIANMRRN